MALTFAFDIYGTLIDTRAVAKLLASWIGKEAAAVFSLRWREKQLEYSFRRGLMRQYKTFGECTLESLEYTNQLLSANLSDAQKEELMALYGKLPAFGDVAKALSELKSMGARRLAFSNGSEQAVSGLLNHANLMVLIDSIVSVDDIKTFKPNPDVYDYLIKSAACDRSGVWVVSSNPFDVIGSEAAGLRAIWLKRDTQAIFDPWGIQPSLVVNSLSELVSLVKSDTLFS